MLLLIDLQERLMPVIHDHDRFAVDQRPVRLEAANRVGDRREPIGEIRAAATPDLRALAQFADKDSEAVMLDLVQPAGSGGRAIDQDGLARANEADGRISSPAGVSRATSLFPSMSCMRRGRPLESLRRRGLGRQRASLYAC